MSDSQKSGGKQTKQTKQAAKPKQTKTAQQAKQINKNGSGNSGSGSGTSGASKSSQDSSSAQSKQSGPFSAADLNRIVLEYLNKKGYLQTEAMLRAESSRTATPQSRITPGSADYSKQVINPSTPNYERTSSQYSNNVVGKRDYRGNIITTEQQKEMSSPENYIRAYKYLKQWTDSSLEIYRSELNYILYPIFIYIFIKLVAKSPIHARGFFDKYSQNFRLFHSTEINRLFSVNSKDHLKENEIANAFHTNKYKITISRTTLNLLIHFLNESNEGSLIISVINQHLQPNIVETVTSKDTLTDGIKRIIDHGKAAADSDLNSQPIKLGRFPHDPEYIKEIEIGLKIMDDKEKQQFMKESRPYPPNNKTLLQEFKILNGEDLEKKAEDTDEKSADKDDKSTKHEDKKNANKFMIDFMESPAIDTLPLPPKTALDIKLEIQKVKEVRDSVNLEDLSKELPSVCMYTFHNTNRDMLSLDFSDDCRLAAAGFQDSFIKVWSLDGSPLAKKHLTDAQIANSHDKLNASNDSELNNINSLKKKQYNQSATGLNLVGHSGAIYSTSFSPDNKLLVSSSEDKTVRLWSLDTQTALVTYRGHNHPVWDVQFSPMGHYFATASHDQTARLWSCDHIYPLRIFSGHLSDVDCVGFHPNGCYLFTGSSDKSCRMWDISTGESVRLFLGHTASVVSLAVSPDGRWLSTGDEDGVINLWDIASGRRIKQMIGHGKTTIYSLSYNKEGNVLVSSGADQSVRVWDIKKKLNSDNAASTVEIEVNPDDPVCGYFGNPLPYVMQDMKDHGKDNVVIPTSDLVSSFYTKSTPVYKVKFTRSNLVFAGGPLTD